MQIADNSKSGEKEPSVNANRWRVRIFAWFIGIVFLGSILLTAVVIFDRDTNEMLFGMRIPPESETWSHKELVEHLNSHGVRCHDVHMEEGMVRGTARNLILQDESIVFCIRCLKSETPHELARGMSSKEVLPWGRFYFYSANRESIHAVRVALRKVGE